MDLTRNISYRNFLLNDEDIESSIIPGGGAGSGISGCIVESADITDIDVVQYLEKRALRDGMDAGYVYKGARRIRLAGTLFGQTRAELYDSLNDLKSALDPRMAQDDSPADKGYQPLYFSQPTNDTAYAAAPDNGLIYQQIKCVPRQFSAIIQRNLQGGDDNYGLAIPWQATLIARDPKVMAQDYQDYDLSAGGTVSGNTVNRGNYPGILNMAIEVGSTAGSIACQVGDSVFTITVPSSTGNRIIRLNGDKGVLTFEESSVETTQMGAIAYTGDNTWPRIPVGTNGYAITFTGLTPVAGSHMWFYEAYS